MMIKLDLSQKQLDILSQSACILTKMANGNVRNPDFGICNNLDEVGGYGLLKRLKHKDTSIMHLIWRDWEHFSGFDGYPVPSDIPDITCVTRFWRGGKWQGKYGELRKDLAKHAANWIRENLLGE